MTFFDISFTCCIFYSSFLCSVFTSVSKGQFSSPDHPLFPRTTFFPTLPPSPRHTSQSQPCCQGSGFHICNRSSLYGSDISSVLTLPFSWSLPSIFSGLPYVCQKLRVEARGMVLLEGGAITAGLTLQCPLSSNQAQTLVCLVYLHRVWRKCGDIQIQAVAIASTTWNWLFFFSSYTHYGQFVIDYLF